MKHSPFIFILIALCVSLCAQEKNAAEQSIDVQLAIDFPSGSYGVSLREIYYSKSDYALLALVLVYEQMGIQIPCTRQTEKVRITAPSASKVRYFVLDPKKSVPKSERYTVIATYHEFLDLVACVDIGLDHRVTRKWARVDELSCNIGEHLALSIVLSPSGESFLFKLHSPDLMGFSKKMIVQTSAFVPNPGTKPAIWVRIAEKGVYPGAKARALEISREQGEVRGRLESEPFPDMVSIEDVGLNPAALPFLMEVVEALNRCGAGIRLGILQQRAPLLVKKGKLEQQLQELSKKGIDDFIAKAK